MASSDLNFFSSDPKDFPPTNSLSFRILDVLGQYSLTNDGSERHYHPDARKLGYFVEPETNDSGELVEPMDLNLGSGKTILRNDKVDDSFEFLLQGLLDNLGKVGENQSDQRCVFVWNSSDS